MFLIVMPQDMSLHHRKIATLLLEAAPGGIAQVLIACDYRGGAPSAVFLCQPKGASALLSFTPKPDKRQKVITALNGLRLAMATAKGDKWDFINFAATPQGGIKIDFNPPAVLAKSR